jgi:hypothetical protein
MAKGYADALHASSPFLLTEPRVLKLTATVNPEEARPTLVLAAPVWTKPNDLPQDRILAVEH